MNALLIEQHNPCMSRRQLTGEGGMLWTRKWWIATAGGLILAALLVLVTLPPGERMEVTITDLRYEWQQAFVEWVVPTNRSDRIYTFVLFGRATNHGDPGWVTVLGYYESDRGRREEEQRIYLSTGTSTIIFITFGDVGDPYGRDRPVDFQYGFDVVLQEPTR